MAKYILYALIALGIAYAVEFFGIYDVPYISVPGQFQSDAINRGRDRQREAVEEIEQGRRQ